MTESPLAAAQRLAAQAVDALRDLAAAGSAGERVAVLGVCEAVARRLDQVTVATVAGLDRDGVFTERGYTSPVQALSDLLGWERFEARRTVAAEQVTARTGLDGSVLPARLAATAAAGRGWEAQGPVRRRGDVRRDRHRPGRPRQAVDPRR